MCKYGYVRISTTKQSIDRQIRNIERCYPGALIIIEKYTGTTINRPSWNKLKEKVKKGDTIIFDSVSRMSRNAKEGIKTYFELYENGINLVFLKEPYINTSVYAENMKDKLQLQGTKEDILFKALNEYFKALAENQIEIAFNQAEKEVDDLRQRTKEGIETARLNGKQIGQKHGSKLTTKKSIDAKEKILKWSKDFNGNMTDAELINALHLSRNTFYKYKSELKYPPCVVPGEE